MKKNLIIGLISGYDFELLRPFVTTLKRTGYGGDILFLYSDIDKQTLDKLESFGATLSPFDKKFPYVSDDSNNRWRDNPRVRNMAVYCLRYLLAYLYLRSHADKYENIMLTDTRDVIFQGDPFDFQISDKLCCFVENEGFTIADSSVNSDWIRRGFGEEEYSMVADKPIVCSGVTIGSVASALKYLELFMDTIVSKDVPAELRGMDQGIHNYLIHNELLPVTLYDNETGPVLTMGLEDKVSFKFGKIYNSSGGIPNVVHQYDRHWAVAKRFWSLRLIWRERLFLWKCRVKKLFKLFGLAIN